LFVFPFVLLIKPLDFKKILIIAVLLLANLFWIIPSIALYPLVAASQMVWFETTIPITFLVFSLVILAILPCLSLIEKNDLLKKFLVFNSILFLFVISGISAYLPILNKLAFSLYLQYFTVIAIYFLIKNFSKIKIESLSLDSISSLMENKLFYFSIIFIIASTAYSVIYFADFSEKIDFNNTLCSETGDFAPEINDLYMFIGDSKGCYMYGYLTGVHEKKTLFNANGYSLSIYLADIHDEIKSSVDKSCDLTSELLTTNKIKYVICINEFCEKLSCIETISSTENLQLKSLNN